MKNVEKSPLKVLTRVFIVVKTQDRENRSKCNKITGRMGGNARGFFFFNFAYDAPLGVHPRCRITRLRSVSKCGLESFWCGMDKIA